MELVTPATMQPTVRIANYIAYGAGSAWLDRRIPDLELVLVVSGGLRYDTEDEAVTVGPDELLTILPGRRHSLRPAPGVEQGIVSCIHGELVAGGTWLGGDYRFSLEPRTVTRCPEPALLHDLFKRCSATFSGYGRWRLELARTIAREIWLLLAEQWTQPADVRLSRRMGEMVEYLRRHLTGTVSRQDLARRFHITPEHVNYLFRQELGLSPTQFVQRERILLAYRLIREEQLSVKEAAARVGFGDPFYFSRLFKRLAGVAPSEV